MPKHVKYLLFVLLLFLKLNCNTPADIELSASFEKWFTGPHNSTIHLKSLDSISIDSIVKQIRSSAKAGTFAQTLTDSSGTEYVTGYKTPRKIKADTLYPLIIYLHGGTRTEVNTKGEKAFEMLSPLADTMPLFLASPSANKDAFWWSPWGLFRILQTLRFLTLHYPIDPDKVFLAGVSDGAAGCWAAANTICAPFAGFISISGYGGILPITGMQVAPENIMQRPIYNVHAGKDHLYSLQTVNSFIDHLEENGVNVKRKVYLDEKHGFDYRTQEIATLCHIIKTWSRPAIHAAAWTYIPGFPNLPQNIISVKYSEKNEKRFINGFCISDTCIIRSGGLSSIILRLPENGPGLFKSNGQPVKKYRNLNMDCNRYLQIMKNTCFPVYDNCKLVQINLN